MITTVHSDQDELLLGLMELYGIQRFDVDPTFSKGGFYRGRIPTPNHCYDIEPSAPGVEKADVRNLPHGNSSVESVIFDPPFIHAHGKGSKMGSRFGSYPSQKKLMELYCGALDEFQRVLVDGGILVFKCQDIVESGKQVWNHIRVYENAVARGFSAEDLFVLVAKHRMAGHNHGNQVHARKFHSYFWVFRKRGG